MKICAMFASIAMPFFNIPLVIRIWKRRSSEDISLIWAWGVYACMLLMLPYGLQSDDIVLKSFSLANISLFSIVVAITIWFRIYKTDIHR